MIRLATIVPSIGKNRLPINPLARSTQEPHNRSNILHLRQTTLHGHALVELHRALGFLRVEESYS
jgi:hypothetical protein